MISASSTLIESFNVDDVNVALKWDQWIERLEQFFDANGYKVETDDKKMCSTMFLLGGSALNDLYKTFKTDVEVKNEEGTTVTGLYKIACFKLKKYFNPKRNRGVEVFKFESLRQSADESIQCYVTRLRVGAKYCEFKETEDTRIMDHVLKSCHSTKFREKLLGQSKLELDKLLELGITHDAIKNQVRLVEGREPEKAEHVESVNVGKKIKKKGGDENSNSKEAKGSKKCFKCAGDWPHNGDCPAKDYKCKICNKVGHLEVKCRMKNKSQYKKEEKVEEIYSGKQFNSFNPAYLFSVGEKTGTPEIKLHLLGENLDFRIDTCASVNVMDEMTYSNLKTKPVLKEYFNPTFGYGHTRLHSLGQFSSSISNKNNTLTADFVVMKGSSGCLLGFQTSKDLGLVKILCGNREIINSIKDQDTNNMGDIWARKFPNVFSDKLGKLKNYEVELHIDKNVKPIQARARHKPYHLRDKIKKEIEKKLRDDVIEKVEGEPTEWLSETVVVPKKGTDEVRLCTDMSAANTAIKCEKYEMPNADDIVYKANGAKIFSKVDLNRAFEQFLISKKSRYISMFRTFEGIYQHKRLFFGVSSAPELFHNKIKEILSGIEGVQNAADDILIISETIEENIERCEKVFRRLDEYGLTVNKDKCVFNVTEIMFFGMKLSYKGISLSDEKTKALKEFKTPSDSSELHSFLGLSSYCSRYIKDLASIAEPLWKLTSKKVKWEWNKDYQDRFDRIKDGLIENIGYFKLDWETQVTVDASPVGLGASLTQTNPKNDQDKVVICYISKMLTESESRYSQIEKEALALPWACERLHLYLLGHEFVIYTDNKAVSLIFSNPLANPPAVIKRWRLRMDGFRCKYVHRAGLGNIADFLSRHPLKERTESKYIDDTVEYLNLVVQYSIPAHLSKDSLLEETLRDKGLRELTKMIKSDTFSKGRGADKYQKMFKELSLTLEGIILREERVIIPESLTDQVINLAHQGHLGIMKTKNLIRTKVWFPELDIKVENKIKNCLACQACEPTSHKLTPLKMSSMPSVPWEEISVDFFGPIQSSSEYLLVIQDDYSRFPVVPCVFSLKSPVIEKRLESIFALLGYPEVMRTDNGPPFNSNSFSVYCKRVGIFHRLITPLWPRANGLVECFMKSLGKVLRTAKVDKVDWRVRLTEFLKNYRNSPHSTTGVAPASLLLRNSRFASFPEICTKFTKSDIDRAAIKNDQEGKQRMKDSSDK